MKWKIEETQNGYLLYSILSNGNPVLVKVYDSIEECQAYAKWFDDYIAERKKALGLK